MVRTRGAELTNLEPKTESPDGEGDRSAQRHGDASHDGHLSAPYPGHSWRRTAAAVALALTAIACDGSTASESAAEGANRLQHETSPYLLLHAHNPVDWYPWGPEALERARREDKPIFLSVGYSTCYWCHVMERKVFADPQIAAMMNR